MKKFNSKPGLELVLPVSALLGLLLYLAIRESNWWGAIITSLVIILFVYLLSTTKYIIAGKKLEIKCGIFYDRFIDIMRIKKITTVTDFFEAPATSVNRLEIYFDEINSVEITPANKAAFINSLLHVNPSIEIKVSS